MYRKPDVDTEVFLVHPGGPFWAKKDYGAWSIPKGEFAEGEDALEAASVSFMRKQVSPQRGHFSSWERSNKRAEKPSLYGHSRETVILRHAERFVPDRLAAKVPSTGLRFRKSIAAAGFLLRRHRNASSEVSGHYCNCSADLASSARVECGQRLALCLALISHGR